MIDIKLNLGELFDKMLTAMRVSRIKLEGLTDPSIVTAKFALSRQLGITSHIVGFKSRLERKGYNVLLVVPDQYTVRYMRRDYQIKSNISDAVTSDMFRGREDTPDVIIFDSVPKAEKIIQEIHEVVSRKKPVYYFILGN